MKYILLCPSDIYSMIQSLQTGMNKNIVDPYQTAPKREGSLIDFLSNRFHFSCSKISVSAICLASNASRNKIVNTDQFILLEV